MTMTFNNNRLQKHIDQWSPLEPMAQVAKKCFEPYWVQIGPVVETRDFKDENWKVYDIEQ